SLMPEGSSITWGGSETLRECGLMDAIHEKNYELIDRAAARTPEESRAIYGKMVCADFFLMSSNAVTIDGELVNIDGHANRVACLCCGPQNVIVIAGMNKVTPDVESAVKRIRNFAAPPNTVRLNKNTPCAKTGRCADCYSPDCICSQIVITRRSSIPNRIKVILVGEELGY
ncbi:MAG: lactate utilization protein, partial [Lachnospiraceae bacterium]